MNTANCLLGRVSSDEVLKDLTSPQAGLLSVDVRSSKKVAF